MRSFINIDMDLTTGMRLLYDKYCYSINTLLDMPPGSPGYLPYTSILSANVWGQGRGQDKTRVQEGIREHSMKIL